MNLFCPDCLEKLEPQGNISNTDHRFGKTTEGRVSCSNCGFTGKAVIQIIETEGSE